MYGYTDKLIFCRILISLDTPMEKSCISKCNAIQSLPRLMYKEYHVSSSETMFYKKYVFSVTVALKVSLIETCMSSLVALVAVKDDYLTDTDRCRTKWSHCSKHSGSIPRNACVACETAMHDYQESVITGQTDRRRTKWSLCATMLHRWYKTDNVNPLCRLWS